MMIPLCMIDYDRQLLPDTMTLPLLWGGLLLSLGGVFVDTHTSIIGAVAGYLSLWSIYHIFKLLTGKEGMGYGDFKLLAALGAWLGWQQLPLIILMSAVVGAIVGIGFYLGYAELAEEGVVQAFPPAQGARDPILGAVGRLQFDVFLHRMREEYGVEVEYLVKQNEGHGFQNEENRFEFYGAMERFLARRLGAGAPGTGSGATA